MSKTYYHADACLWEKETFFDGGTFLLPSKLPEEGLDSYIVDFDLSTGIHHVNFPAMSFRPNPSHPGKYVFASQDSAMEYPTSDLQEADSAIMSFKPSSSTPLHGSTDNAAFQDSILHSILPNTHRTTSSKCRSKNSLETVGSHQAASKLNFEDIFSKGQVGTSPKSEGKNVLSLNAIEDEILSKTKGGSGKASHKNFKALRIQVGLHVTQDALTPASETSDSSSGSFCGTISTPATSATSLTFMKPLLLPKLRIPSTTSTILMKPWILPNIHVPPGNTTATLNALDLAGQGQEQVLLEYLFPPWWNLKISQRQYDNWEAIKERVDPEDYWPRDGCQAQYTVKTTSRDQDIEDADSAVLHAAHEGNFGIQSTNDVQASHTSDDAETITLPAAPQPVDRELIHAMPSFDVNLRTRTQKFDALDILRLEILCELRKPKTPSPSPHLDVDSRSISKQPFKFSDYGEDNVMGAGDYETQSLLHEPSGELHMGPVPASLLETADSVSAIDDADRIKEGAVQDQAQLSLESANSPLRFENIDLDAEFGQSATELDDEATPDNDEGYIEQSVENRHEKGKAAGDADENQDLHLPDVLARLRSTRSQNSSLPRPSLSALALNKPTLPSLRRLDRYIPVDLMIEINHEFHRLWFEGLDGRAWIPGADEAEVRRLATNSTTQHRIGIPTTIGDMFKKFNGIYEDLWQGGIPDRPCVAGEDEARVQKITTYNVQWDYFKNDLNGSRLPLQGQKGFGPAPPFIEWFLQATGGDEQYPVHSRAKADEDNDNDSIYQHTDSSLQHHGNFLNNWFHEKSGTPPAVSLFAVVTAGRTQPVKDRYSHKAVVMSQAVKRIDPFKFDGDMSLIDENLKGTALRDFATGRTSIVYGPWGAWLSDSYDEDEDVPTVASGSFEGVGSYDAYGRLMQYAGLQWPHRVQRLDGDILIVNDDGRSRHTLPEPLETRGPWYCTLPTEPSMLRYTTAFIENENEEFEENAVAVIQQPPVINEIKENTAEDTQQPPNTEPVSAPSLEIENKQHNASGDNEQVPSASPEHATSSEGEKTEENASGDTQPEPSQDSEHDSLANIDNVDDNASDASTEIEQEQDLERDLVQHLLSDAAQSDSSTSETSEDPVAALSGEGAAIMAHIRAQGPPSRRASEESIVIKLLNAKPSSHLAVDDTRETQDVSEAKDASHENGKKLLLKEGPSSAVAEADPNLTILAKYASPPHGSPGSSHKKMYEQPLNEFVLPPKKPAFIEDVIHSSSEDNGVVLDDEINDNEQFGSPDAEESSLNTISPSQGLPARDYVPQTLSRPQDGRYFSPRVRESPENLDSPTKSLGGDSWEFDGESWVSPVKSGKQPAMQVDDDDFSEAQVSPTSSGTPSSPPSPGDSDNLDVSPVELTGTSSIEDDVFAPVPNETPSEATEDWGFDDDTDESWQTPLNDLPVISEGEEEALTPLNIQKYRPSISPVPEDNNPSTPCSLTDLALTKVPRFAKVQRNVSRTHIPSQKSAMSSEATTATSASPTPELPSGESSKQHSRSSSSSNQASYGNTNNHSRSSSQSELLTAEDIEDMVQEFALQAKAKRKGPSASLAFSYNTPGSSPIKKLITLDAAALGAALTPLTQPDETEQKGTVSKDVADVENSVDLREAKQGDSPLQDEPVSDNQAIDEEVNDTTGSIDNTAEVSSASDNIVADGPLHDELITDNEPVTDSEVIDPETDDTASNNDNPAQTFSISIHIIADIPPTAEPRKLRPQQGHLMEAGDVLEAENSVEVPVGGVLAAGDMVEAENVIDYCYEDVSEIPLRPDNRAYFGYFSVTVGHAAFAVGKWAVTTWAVRKLLVW